MSKIDDYMSATKKCHKGQVVIDILADLDSIGARFLKMEKQTKRWYTINSPDAREKVSHAIRDRVRERKKGKVILADEAILSSPPNQSNKKSSKKKAKKASKAKPVAKRKLAKKASLRRVRVVSGRKNLATLEDALHAGVAFSDGRIVSDDDFSVGSSFSSSDSSTDSTFSEYFSGPAINALPKPGPKKLGVPSTFETTSMGPIVAHTDQCDLSLFDDDSPRDPLAIYVDSPLHDDSSELLDDYNDMFVNEMLTDEEESDFVVSMLQEACAVMFDDY